MPTRPSVAIFGDPLDLHVIAVEEALAARGAAAKLLPQAQLHGDDEPFAELGPKGMRYLGGWTPRAVWLYRLPPPLVMPGPRFEVLAASNAAIALVHAWSERGAKCVNPLGRVLVQNKLLQLDAMRKKRVPVPQTVVCFTHAQVRAAMAKLAPAICKPAAQGWHTVVLTEENAGSVPLPCLVQRRADGDDVRITIVGGRVVSAVHIPSGGAVDFRENPDYGAGRVTYEPVELSAAEKKAALVATRACGLVFAGVDMKRRKKNAFVILEANPAPAWLDVEQKLGHPVSRSLAHLLLA